MDRELLLRFPHLVVEGVILAGLFTGASGATSTSVTSTLSRSRPSGPRSPGRPASACGPDVFESGIAFPVEVREPGRVHLRRASALLEAMEDRRAPAAEPPPRTRQQWPADKPTVVNNVETLAWAPYVILRG